MKRIYLMVLLILFTDTLFGLNFHDIFDDRGADFFPVKYELSISEGFQLNHEFSIGLVNPYFENFKTGFGFDIRSPKYSFNFQNHVINFFGMSIYWNIFRLIDSNKKFINESIFGSLFSINYPNWDLSESFNTMFYNYNFKIGIRYSKLWILDDEPEGRFIMHLFNFEVGYKNTNGINNVYLTIDLNIFNWALFFVHKYY